MNALTSHHMMHFVLIGLQGDIGSNKGMDSTCLQNIVVVTNENTQMGMAANGTSDDSQDESEGCQHGTHEMKHKSNEFLLLGKERVRTAGNVELSKRNAQHAVEVYPQQESFQAHEALDFTSAREHKLLDVIMSQVDFEERDMNKLSALTEDSPNGTRLHPEDPQVSELKNEGNCVTEEEHERGVDHREDFGTEMDPISKSEELRSQPSNRRTTSANSKGPPSQFVSRPSCLNLMRVKDTVERAIRVSTTNILYRRALPT
jgi:hypothetical protein